MKKLLKLKHWQLFLLLVGIPMLFQIGVMMALVGDNIAVFAISSSAIVLLSLLSTGLLLSWFWAISVHLHPRLPENTPMNLKRFKIFFWIPIFYFLSFMFLVNYIAREISQGTEPSVVSIFFIILMHLFSMFCIFHTMYFAAKTMKAVEFRRRVGFGDYAGEFFLMWFFPIGVWIIQPRLNRLLEEEDEDIEKHLVD